MKDPSQEEITQILRELPGAGPTSSDESWQVLYREILRIARTQRRRWEGEWTLETRALANEVYLKVFGKTIQDFRDRQHFFRLVAKAIRQILINYAEERRAAKRGGGADPVTIEDAYGFGFSEKVTDQVRDLHRALERFESVDPRAAEVVQLKFFVGLRIEEIAEVLDVSKATVARDWTSARAWLWREMGEWGGDGPNGSKDPTPELI